MARDLTNPGALPHDQILAILARSEAGPLKALAEAVLPDLSDIDVLRNETGLMMLPMRDTGQGAAFHLGEVLVAHAHILGRAGDGSGEGYGMRIGDDAEAAMAMALLDLALVLEVRARSIAEFCLTQQDRLAAADDARQRDVEATRVRMETF